MLIICEIHHRGTPLVWHATDEADYINRVARSAIKSGEDINDRASATDYLERDLRALFIFEGRDDLADRILSVPTATALKLLERYL